MKKTFKVNIDEAGSVKKMSVISAFVIAGALVLTPLGVSAQSPTTDRNMPAMTENEGMNGNNGTGGSVTDDTTAPMAMFTAPAEGATVRGGVPVRATIKDDGTVSYNMYVLDSAGKKVAEKSGTVQGSSFVDQELVNLDTPKWADGRYQLWLETVDDDGNRDGTFETDGDSSDSRIIVVDNVAGDDDGTGGNDDGGTGGGDDDDGNNGEEPTGPIIEDDLDVTLRVGERLRLSPKITGAERSNFEWEVSNESILADNARLDRQTLRLAPTEAGEYTARLMAFDRDGNEAMVTYDITVTENGNDGGTGGNDDGGDNGGAQNPGGNFFTDMRRSVNTFFVNVYNTFNFWN